MVYRIRQAVNGDGYDITFYKEGVLRTAVVIENGEQNILQINDITGVMTLNGQMVENSTVTLQQKTWAAKSNWTAPTTSVTTLSYVGWGVGLIAGALILKFPLMLSSKAQFIAATIISTGGLLYIKAVSQFNYIDYSPKVGYKLTESLHLTEAATGQSLYSQSLSGSR